MDVYEAIYKRRDVRHFRPDPVASEALKRVLDAAHHAGSVGFMQPWNFLVIRAEATRRAVYDLYREANAKAAEQYTGEQQELYASLKLAGILEAPVNIAVTCDHDREKGAGLGRHSIAATDVYSTCCAIQNLWLAARAEGLGVGWVSIVDIGRLKTLLGIPEPVTLVAYLCLGHPIAFDDKPMLERAGWETRMPLSSVVYAERWHQPSSEVD